MNLPDNYCENLKKQNVLCPNHSRVSRQLYRSFRSVQFERHTLHPKQAFMPLGAFSYTGSYIRNISSLGRYCSLGRNIQVIGDSHPTDWISTSPWQYSQEMPIADGFDGEQGFTPERFDNRPQKISIGDDVWIGQNVMIKEGVHINTGAIVAAGSLVTKNVPQFSIVGGVPAKEIRPRFSVEIIQNIQVLEWWKYDFRRFLNLKPSDPASFLDGLEKLVANEEIFEFPVVRKTAQQWVEAENGIG